MSGRAGDHKGITDSIDSMEPPSFMLQPAGKDLPKKANGPVTVRAIPMKEGGDAHGPQQAVLDPGTGARRLSTGPGTRYSMHRNLAADEVASSCRCATTGG